jgi:hypothetical protein
MRFQLSGHVERLTGMLVGLVDASGEEIDYAELPKVAGITPAQRARVEIVPARLLLENEALGKTSRVGVRLTQAPSNGTSDSLIVRGATEGHALLEHPDGCFQVPLSEVQTAEARANGDRDVPVPLFIPPGKAERLFPVASPFSKLPQHTQHLREPRLRGDASITHVARRATCQHLHVPPQHLGRTAVIANTHIGLPQAIGDVYVQDRIPECGREF